VLPAEDPVVAVSPLASDPVRFGDDGADAAGAAVGRIVLGVVAPRAERRLMVVPVLREAPAF
jgi:hypothetical protein